MSRDQDGAWVYVEGDLVDDVAWRRGLHEAAVRRDLKAIEQHVALVLHRWMDGDGTIPRRAQPGARKIADHCARQPRNVMAALRVLVFDGFLKVVEPHAGTRPTRYRAALPGGDAYLSSGASLSTAASGAPLGTATPGGGELVVPDQHRNGALVVPGQHASGAPLGTEPPGTSRRTSSTRAPARATRKDAAHELDQRAAEDFGALEEEERQQLRDQARADYVERIGQEPSSDALEHRAANLYRQQRHEAEPVEAAS